MKLIRCINRFFRDAIKSVFRNFSLSLASISCIAITLVVVALSIVLSYNVEEMTKHVSSNTLIIVFIEANATEEEEQAIANEISKMDNIADITYKSKQEEVEELASQYGKSFATYASTWKEGQNPLMASYKVKVKDIKLIDETALKIEKLAKVDHTNYGKNFVKSVITIFDMIEKICIGGVVALILVSTFLIANTIKLAIFSRKTEIEIMRLVGASNIAIKVPFIIEGSFIGLFGSIVPIVLTSYGYISLYNYMDGQLFSSSLGKLVPPYPFVFYSSALLLVIGLLVGMYGSARAVRKYLKI